MIHVYRFLLDEFSLLADGVDNPVGYVDRLLRKFGAEPAYDLGGVFVTDYRGTIVSLSEIDVSVQERPQTHVEEIHRVRMIDDDPESLLESEDVVVLDPVLEIEINLQE